MPAVLLPRRVYDTRQHNRWLLRIHPTTPDRLIQKTLQKNSKFRIGFGPPKSWIAVRRTATPSFVKRDKSSRFATERGLPCSDSSAEPAAEKSHGSIFFPKFYQLFEVLLISYTSMHGLPDGSHTLQSLNIPLHSGHMSKVG